jgi:hypothetical protein
MSLPRRRGGGRIVVTLRRRQFPTPPKLIIGIVMGCLGLTCGSVGTGMVAYPDDAGQSEAGMFWLVFSLVALILPAVILVLLGLKARAANRRIEKLAAMANAASRLPLQQLAADLGVPQQEARALLFDAINHGYVAGRLDLEQGVFISGTAHAGVQQLNMHCRNCGATSTVIVSTGHPSLCKYCGFRLA